MPRSYERVGLGDNNSGGDHQSKEGVCRLEFWATANRMHLSYLSAKSCTSATKPTCKIQLDNRHWHSANLARSSRHSAGDKQGERKWCDKCYPKDKYRTLH